MQSVLDVKGSNMFVIQSKVRPPELRDNLVTRERVDQLLQNSVAEHRLTLVLAMGGSGKTSAVLSATTGSGRPLLWLSLDRTDSAPGRILRNLEAAMSGATHGNSVVTEALAAQISPPEVAGLLAETLPDDAVVVVDNLEQLEDAKPAWSVLNSLIKYARRSVAFVLIGRRAIPTDALEMPLSQGVNYVGAEELALTVEEAEAILQRHGQPTDRVIDRVGLLHGWMAGVVYGSAPSSVLEADRVRDLLIENMMADLTPEARSFIVCTAILLEVDSERAGAVLQIDASQFIEELRKQHLPITWARDGNSFRLHPILRDWALKEFSRLPLTEKLQAHQRYADLLISREEFEPAVDEYRRANNISSARDAAARCMTAILERGDLELAELWLQSLSVVEDPYHPTVFTVARLWIAVARGEVGEGMMLADAILDAGTLDEFVHLTDTAGQLLAWSYLFGRQADRTERVIRASPASIGMQAIRYALSLAVPGKPAARPSEVNGMLDVVTFRCDFWLGRLHLLPSSTGSPVTDLLMRPFRIAADRVRGRTQDALDAYRAPAPSIGRTELLTEVGPEVLMDANLFDEAYTTLLEGRALAARRNDGMRGLITVIVEAKILLRGKRDATAAREVLERRHDFPSFAVFDEMAELWLGVAMLMERQDENARSLLDSVVGRMEKHEHLLELGPAAIYLAEAEWRCGDYDAADAAADLALWSARKIGTNHPILQALADYPGVLSRRLDAEGSTETEWHSLARFLAIQQGLSVIDSSNAPVHFRDIGPPAIDVFGETVQPRLSKSFEVLSYILAQPKRQTTRGQLLSALFDVDETSTRTYLRQALKWLRSALPEGGLVTDGERVKIEDNTTIVTDTGRFERSVVEATRLRDDDRIEALARALKILESREFLEGIDSEWVRQRRSQVQSMKLDLQLTLSKYLVDANRLLDADRLVRRVLAEDPLRESGWRMRMRLAHEFHDRDGIVQAFKMCTEALAAIGLQPSPVTRKLVETLTM